MNNTVDTRVVDDVFSEFIEPIVGDTPVSVQLAIALDQMAKKTHTHDEYATRDEVEDLRNKIELLLDLVGDVSVSEQIYAAIKHTK